MKHFLAYPWAGQELSLHCKRFRFCFQKDLKTKLSLNYSNLFLVHLTKENQKYCKEQNIFSYS